MKTIIVMFFFSMCSCLMTDGAIEEKESAKIEHELLFVKNKGDIQLYENIDAGLNTKEYIATFTINMPVQELVYLIKDEVFALSWIKSSHEYSDIVASVNNWHSYIRFAPPWPLNHQDCILHFTLSANYPSGAVIEFKNNPGYIDVKERVTRIKEFEGRWEFKWLDDGNTKVSFIMYSNKFTSNEIKKTIILNTILNSLVAFKEEALQIKQENYIYE